MNIKKLALVIAFLAVTVGIGYLLYRFFFAPAPVPIVVPPATTTPITGGLPSAGTGRPTSGGVPTTPGGLPAAQQLPQVAAGGPTATPRVTEASVLAPTLSSTGGLNYYSQADGKFYRQLPDGTMRTLSETGFPAVQNVNWSPSGDKAVLEFPDRSKVIYDFQTQKQVSIPSHWQDFSFSADGKQLAAMSIGNDPSNRWLITFAADGTDAQLVEPLGNNADKVTVSYSPNGQTVAFSDTGDPVGFDQRDMLLIGKNGENLKPLRVDGFGFEPKWSPNGSQLLFSASAQTDDYKPTLWFAGAQGNSIGDNRTNLGVHTWADKCTFADAQTVYCAVPDSLPEGAGLQREVAVGVPDSIQKIDLRSGTVSTVGRPSTDTSIKDIVVSSDGSKLYFTDALSGTLSQMQLR